MKELYLYTLLAVVLGVLLDFFIGDFQNFWHPVISMGRLISFLEKRLIGWRRKRFAGAIMWLCVTVSSVIIPLIILWLVYIMSIKAYLVLTFIMSYQIMATGSLRKESMKVYYPLKKGDLSMAREAVSMIVGRDVQSLDEKGVTKACVETVAENTSDGCIAPLFYMVLLGPVGGFLYKAVNTMDSMVGYKNEKYKDFGFFAARMDDLFNLIPARLAAIAMILGGFFTGIVIPGIWTQSGFKALKGAIKVYFRDRHKSPSPNSAQTESVMAGMLGVQLLGPAYYFGKLHDKAVIGDGIRDIEVQDIKRANILMYATVLTVMFIFAAVIFAIGKVLVL